MDHLHGTIGQQIARAAHLLEKRRSMQGRKWEAVFMNEDTILIALHGSLTAAEKIVAQSPAGAAEVLDFHRQLFTNASDTLRQQIKCITGMEVCATTGEIDPAIGSVVHLFTTDTVVQEFPLTPGRTTVTRPPGQGRPHCHERSAGRQARHAGFVIRR